MYTIRHTENGMEIVHTSTGRVVLSMVNVDDDLYVAMARILTTFCDVLNREMKGRG